MRDFTKPTERKTGTHLVSTDLVSTEKTRCVPVSHLAGAILLVWVMGVTAQEPQSPAQTLAALKLPPGFSATLFAGEPDVRQPIGFCFDDRGRLWVAENFTYPHFKKTGNDQISVFEDVDHDGRFDKKTVFHDKFNYLMGLEVGFGGVWAVSPPNLLFIPDRDGDDKPDGEPVIVLEGFGTQGVHNVVNGCVWGPDGWLYGGHGGTSNGMIGPPGAKEEEKQFWDGGVWRYHPTKKKFELFMKGTTNPWGLDFDDHGFAFISNSVTPHLYHVIQGAHVERRVANQNSKYAYGLIPTIADHLHWQGRDWTSGRGSSEQVVLGGGHAHCGLMVYLGDNWPDQYRGTIFMNNIHGDRMNNDLPSRKGSGFVARHGKDFLTSGDPWYMALHVKCGHDGTVYLSDWYDTGECHTRKPRTENGRIYRIAHGDTSKLPPPRDVAKMTSAELVELHLHKNDWWVRKARRVLQERGKNESVHAALRKMLDQNPDVTRRLRALWALHVAGGADAELLRGLLKDPSEYLRAWAIQLLSEDHAVDAKSLAEFERLAVEDDAPLVRLYLASMLQRIPNEQRWSMLEKLVAHGEDAADQNLPQMYWYALEPLAVVDKKRALELAMKGKIPKLREYVTRRIAEKAK